MKRIAILLTGIVTAAAIATGSPEGEAGDTSGDEGNVQKLEHDDSSQGAESSLGGDDQADQMDSDNPCLGDISDFPASFEDKDIGSDKRVIPPIPPKPRKPDGPASMEGEAKKPSEPSVVGKVAKLPEARTDLAEPGKVDTQPQQPEVGNGKPKLEIRDSGLETRKPTLDFGLWTLMATAFIAGLLVWMCHWIVKKTGRASEMESLMKRLLDEACEKAVKESGARLDAIEGGMIGKGEIARRFENLETVVKAQFAALGENIGSMKGGDSALAKGQQADGGEPVRVFLPVNGEHVATDKTEIQRLQKRVRELEDERADTESTISELRDELSQKQTLLHEKEQSEKVLSAKAANRGLEGLEGLEDFQRKLESWRAKAPNEVEIAMAELLLIANCDKMEPEALMGMLKDVSVSVSTILSKNGFGAEEARGELQELASAIQQFSSPARQFSLEVPSIGSQIDTETMKVVEGNPTTVGAVRAWAVYGAFGIQYAAEVM